MISRSQFERDMGNRLRAEVERLGGQRAAARKAHVSPGAVAGWLRKRKRSLPDLFSLVALTSDDDGGDTSLDYLCGRNVPEFVNVTRTPADLSVDLCLYVEAALRRSLPAADVDRHLADDVLGRAVELLRRDVEDSQERDRKPLGQLRRHLRRKHSHKGRNP